MTATIDFSFLNLDMILLKKTDNEKLNAKVRGARKELVRIMKDENAVLIPENFLQNALIFNRHCAILKSPIKISLN